MKREGERLSALLSSVCGIYYIPRRKTLQIMKTWLADLGSASDRGRKTAFIRRRATDFHKRHIWGWPGRVQLPVHPWEALWMATEAPRVWLCGIWMLPKVIATSCQVLSGEDKQIPPRLREMSTKLQNKGHIHGQTKQPKLDGTEGIMLRWIHKVWGKGGSQDACFTFQEKGHTTMTLEEEIQLPCAPIYHSVVLSTVNCQVN